MGFSRIKKNLGILNYSNEETKKYLRNIILSTPLGDIEGKGKNYYFKCTINDVVLTVNSQTFTVITAKRVR